MKLRWCTTTPNPAVTDYSTDAGQRGWKLHLVETGKVSSERFRGYVKPQAVDVSPALCGLRPAHGWGLDLFIEDECSRCVGIAAKRGLELPKDPDDLSPPSPSAEGEKLPT